MPILRIVGTSPDFYRELAPYATDPAIINKRGNLAITTKESMTWLVLKKNGKIKAFIGEDPIHLPNKVMKDKTIPPEQRPLQQTKLQAFVVLDATDDELLGLLEEVVDRFKKSPSPMLTASVLNEHAILFKKAHFKVTGYKVNFTDLAIIKT